MGRPAKAKAPGIASVEEAVSAMAELLAGQLEDEALTARRDLGVARLHARYETRIDASRQRVAERTAALEDYYYSHLAEIEAGGAKHLQLPNGRIGRRDHPPKLAPLNKSWTWARITDLVKVVHAARFFIPKDPVLDRDRIKAELVVEELKQLGLKIEQGESFYAEPARLPAMGA